MQAGVDVAASGLARIAGTGMVLAFVAMAGGGILWSTGPSTAGTSRHAWERGLLMAAIVLTAAGLVLLAVHLRGTPAGGIALAGALLYAGAGVLGLLHEAALLSTRFPDPAWTVPAYVVLAFLGQAVVGLALTRAPGFPAAIGYAVVVWNVAWLLILAATTPGDLYFPVLHHVMPALVAIPLLLRG